MVAARSPDELFAAVPWPTLVVDQDGMVADVSSAVEIVANASRGALIGRPWPAVLTLPAACATAMTSDDSVIAYDAQVAIAQGARFAADCIVAALAAREGWHIVAMAPRAAHGRADVAAAPRTATGVAAMLAHEIKNPLSGIRGAAQLIDDGDDASRRAMTQLIRDEVDRIATLIDRMEAFTDERPVVRAPENIYAIIDRARAIATAGFAHDAVIADRFDPSLPLVEVHRDSMIQVVVNLLKNACEAAPAGERPRIELTTRYRHGVSAVTSAGVRVSVPIELCVIDHGPGPAPDIAAHLFAPFVTTKASGQGLGLALVDKLVRDSHGVVQFAREGHPERTVFRVLMPRAR